MKNYRSKVQEIYALKDKAKDINKKINTFKEQKYKYISFKHTPLNDRILVMHVNEMKYIKGDMKNYIIQQ